MKLPDAQRDDESAPFFAGTAEGRLLVKRCAACGHHVRPAAIACTSCHGTDLAWVEAAGTATLVTWTVLHAGDDAVVAGVVELDEGPWLHARLVDVDQGALTVGTPLVVGFADAGEERVPVFSPRA